MADFTKETILTGFVPDQLPRFQDLFREHRESLEASPVRYTEIITVTTPSSANTEFLVTLQSLNRTPSYYIPLKKDKAVDIYTGTTAWSKNKLYLKASATTAIVTLLVVG